MRLQKDNDYIITLEPSRGENEKLLLTAIAQVAFDLAPPIIVVDGDVGDADPEYRANDVLSDADLRRHACFRHGAVTGVSLAPVKGRDSTVRVRLCRLVRSDADQDTPRFRIESAFYEGDLDLLLYAVDVRLGLLVRQPVLELTEQDIDGSAPAFNIASALRHVAAIAA